MDFALVNFERVINAVNKNSINGKTGLLLRARCTILEPSLESHTYIVFSFFFRLFCFDLVSFKTFVYNNRKRSKKKTQTQLTFSPLELLVFNFVFDSISYYSYSTTATSWTTRIYVCLLRRSSNCVALLV